MAWLSPGLGRYPTSLGPVLSPWFPPIRQPIVISFIPWLLLGPHKRRDQARCVLLITAASIDRVAPLVLLKCWIKAIEEVRRQPASPRVGGWEERACWRNDGNGHGCVCLSACRVLLTVRGASRRGRGPSRPPSQHPRLSSQHTADTHRSRRNPPCGGTPPADQSMRPSALPAP